MYRPVLIARSVAGLRVLRYLADHRHARLRLPGVEMWVKNFHCGQRCNVVLSSQDVDQTVQLHRTEVLTSLRTTETPKTKML